jgi:hypothetical protein
MQSHQSVRSGHWERRSMQTALPSYRRARGSAQSFDIEFENAEILTRMLVRDGWESRVRGNHGAV